MNRPVLNAALGAPGSGAPAAASIRAVLLDPSNSQQGEVWFRLDRGTPSYTWSPDLGRPPAASARILVTASLTEVSGATRSVPQTVFAVGEAWQLTGLRPFTVWALPYAIDGSVVESVTVTLGVAAADGRLEDPVRLELRPDESPLPATLFAENFADLAYTLDYHWRDGGTLKQPLAPVPAAFLTVPPPPPTGKLTVALDAPTADELDVTQVEATLIDGDGLRHEKTWSPDGFGEPWSLRLPAEEPGVATARLSYRVSFADATLPVYVSPEATVVGPGPIRLGFFGAARFVATPTTFEQLESLKVSVTAPVEGSSGTVTAKDPIGWVVLPGDAPGAPLPGETPLLRWQTTYDLGDGNTTIVPGEGRRPAVELEDPLGVKTFSFVPVWSSEDAQIRRIQVSYRSLEQGAGWKIEGRAQSRDLEPGTGVLSTTFPVRDVTRAAVVYSGRVITSKGSKPLPEAVVTGSSMPVGGVEPWLSVSVDSSQVDWRLFDEVVVELRRDGTPEASGTLRFTAVDGPRPWGFYGASAAQRRYDVKATYRGLGGERTLTRKQETAELFVLPKAPEDGR